MNSKTSPLESPSKAPPVKWINPITSGVIGGLIFLLISFAVFRAEAELVEVRFRNLSASIDQAVADRLDTYIQVLRGGIGLFYASDEVNREEFGAYFQGLELAKSYPGIQGVGFAQALTPPEIPAFEKQIRAEGFPDFKVWPEYDSQVRSAIKFLEPFDDRNRRAFGFDMLSEPTRNAAAIQAAESGEPVVSGKVTLVQETDKDVQAGFLAYLPLFEDEGKTKLKGFVYSPFRMNDLLKGVLEKDTERLIYMEIYDGSEVDPDALMYASPVPLVGKDTLDLKEVKSILVSGRTWTIATWGRPGFHGLGDHVPSIIILIAGILITLSVSAIIGSLRSTEAKARSLAQEMTQELRDSQTEIEELVQTLEKRVDRRTERLESINKELEAFSYSVSHDLRSPLRTIEGFSTAVVEDYGEVVGEEGRDLLSRIVAGTKRMDEIISDMLELSQISKATIKRESIDLSALAASQIFELQSAEPDHRVAVTIAPGLTASGDKTLLHSVLQNVIQNAWKYSHKTPSPTIDVGQDTSRSEAPFYIKDNGVGFKQEQAEKAFEPFRRLHAQKDFEGSGIGLATVRRIIQRHGGKIWIETAPNEGVTVFFTTCEAPV